MKIKLRDMTFEQYEQWRVEKCAACENCIFKNVKCHRLYDNVWVKHKDLYSDKFLDQEIEIDVPILTDEERQYLRAVIKPFRDNVLSIAKRHYLDSYEYMQIFVHTYDSDEVEEVALPNFKKGTMYKGMETNKKYTLEELGL